MKEKLQQYALLAEIISAAAIVISLIFVGFQINQGTEETRLNTKAIQATVRQSIMHEDIAGLYLYMNHPYLDKRTNILAEERVPITAQIIAFIRMRESLWLQLQDGLIDEATWLSYREPLINVVFQAQFGRDVWAGSHWAPGFVEEIDAWISNLEIQDRDTVLTPVNVGDKE